MRGVGTEDSGSTPGRRTQSNAARFAASGGGHRAVTRSVTRKRSSEEHEQEHDGNVQGRQTGRKRLLERLRRGAPQAESKMKDPETSTGVDDGEPEYPDFCPDKFHGSFSCTAVQEIVSTFGPKKLQLLNKLGLNGLKYLKPGLTNSRHLVFWLFKRMDADKMQINLPDGSKIHMDLESVKKVMGIRCTGQDIVCSEGKVSESAKLSLCGRFGHGGAKDLPELDDLRRAISYDYGHSMSKHDEDTFMIALSAFVCAYMFGPPRRTAGVPRDIWEFISNPVNLLNCNWGAYVLKVIQSCARTVQMNLSSNPTSIKLGGCWLYLEVRSCATRLISGFC